MIITRAMLKKSKPENIKRLAKWLKLSIEGMGLNQIIKLILWKLKKERNDRY